MTPPGRPAPPARAGRLYAWSLRLYPRSHRRAYGPLVLQAFRDSYRDALATHGRAGARFWLKAIADTATSLVREWGAALREGIARWRRRRLAIASGLLLAAGVILSLAACGR
jgi:hypothetical protein